MCASAFTAALSLECLHLPFSENQLSGMPQAFSQSCEASATSLWGNDSRTPKLEDLKARVAEGARN